MNAPDPEDFVEEQDVSEFTSILTHLYRGEMQRAYTWRSRLDTTTNWSILLLSALITWTFSDPSNPHELLLFSLVFVGLLLVIESRRYMYYNLWNSRVRALERDYIARTINPKEKVTSRRWMEELAEDLKNPYFKISFWTALSHRVRRVYIWLFSVCILLWLGKLAIHPTQTNDISIIVQRAQFFGISGTIIFAALISFFIVIILIAYTVPKIEGEGEWDRIRRDPKCMGEWKKDI